MKNMMMTEHVGLPILIILVAAGLSLFIEGGKGFAIFILLSGLCFILLTLTVIYLSGRWEGKLPPSHFIEGVIVLLCSVGTITCVSCMTGVWCPTSMHEQAPTSPPVLFSLLFLLWAYTAIVFMIAPLSFLKANKGTGSAH